jgi:2-polyprenyl-6-hydroxyphenyl methylase/3-demethylubiquinone-9 3-methyltransferase
MSDQWWDTKYNPLISMNPIRMRFIQQCIQQYYDKNGNHYNTRPDPNGSGTLLSSSLSSTATATTTTTSLHHDTIASPLNILDIGCGGGLLCESFVRLGMGQLVVGLDPSTSLIQMAQYHAQSTMSPSQQRTPALQYYNTTVQDFYHNICNHVVTPFSSTPDTTRVSVADKTDIVHNNDRKFDIICCLEVLEHVSKDQRMDILQVACQHLLRDNGLLFISTINPTIKSYIVTILGAEYISRILPINTHNWHQYLSPITIRNDLASLSLIPPTVVMDGNDDDNDDDAEDKSHEQQQQQQQQNHQVSIRMMERSVTGMVVPITSIPATLLFNQWNWQLDPNDTDVNWIGCYQKEKTVT